MGFHATTILVFLVAFGPPALFTMWMARAKRYRREPGHAVRNAFLWGASGAAFLALVVNTLLSGEATRPYALQNVPGEVYLAVIVAPLVEETVKPLVLYMGTVRRNCDEVVDGFIYGAAAGLGFSATENLFYEIAAFTEGGLVSYWSTAIARTFSSSLLHATATAITGYGIARYLNGRSSVVGVVPYFAAATLLHAAFNAIATLYLGVGLIGLFALAGFGVFYVRKRITQLSLVAPHDTWFAAGPSRSYGAGPPSGPDGRGGGHARTGDRDTGWRPVRPPPRKRPPDEPERWVPQKPGSRR